MWSKAVYNHIAAVDGIYYPSRHQEDLFSIALFDHAQGAVLCNQLGVTLDDTTNATLVTVTNRIFQRWSLVLRRKD